MAQLTAVVGIAMLLLAIGIASPPTAATGFLLVGLGIAARDHLVEPRNRFLQSIAATRDMSDDRRAPVLLLRSYSRSKLAGTPRYGRSSEIADFVPADPDAVLRDVSSILQWCLGPVITVEQPHRFDKGRYGQVPALNQTWRSIVILTARVARCVVIIPDHSPGIEEEMRWMLGGNSQALVVMPPGPEGRLVFSSGWEDVRRRWARQRFQLPEYDVAGAVYLANSDLSPRILIGLKGRLANLERALPQLVSATPCTVPTSAIAALAGELAFTPEQFPSAITEPVKESLRHCLSSLSDGDVELLARECRVLQKVMSDTPGLKWWWAVVNSELETRSYASPSR